MANTTNRTTRIKHVYGNVLKLAIPLTLRTVTLEGGIVEVTDTDYTPSNHYPVVVQFVNGPLKYELDATIRDNYIAVVEDKGTIPVGNYAIVVLCKDDNGDPRRFKQRCVLEVVDVTADAGIEVGIEFEAQEWLLDGAIFLAIKGEDGIDGVGIESITTDETSVSGEYNQVTFHLTNGSSYTLNVRNGESTEQTLPANVVIDENYVHTDNNYTDTDKQKVESVDKLFADAEYDRISRRLNFFKHGDTMHTNPLKSIDITDFIRDSRVSSFRIVDGNLTIKLNSDGNNEEFKVPITSINANYYTKAQVDAKVDGKADTTEVLTKTQHLGADGKLKSEYATQLVLYYMGEPYDEGITTPVQPFQPIFDNGYISYAISGSTAHSLGQPQPHILYCNAKTNKLYRWNGSEFVQVGGSGSGDGGYEPPIGGIPKTDLAPTVQASLDLADSALQSSDLEGYATTDDVDDAVAALVSSAPQTLDTLKELADALGDDPNFATTMATQLGNKVDKETGKGLSTNDYTTAEKTKLASIAAGAEVNVQPNWTQTNTSADDYIKNKPDLSTFATKSEVNAKQDTINDLDAIRSGAALGATALQSFTEEDPTVPSWAKQSSKPTYTAQEVGALPASTTIPSKTSDLTNDSGFTSNAGTITGITMNGASKGTSGVVDLGTVITAHQDISGKANASDVYTKTQTYNKDELDAMLDDIEAGDTIVVNSDGANIVDEHDNNSVLFAPSARQMKLMYENVMAIYNGLANTAFTNGKPTLDWVGEKTKYTLSYGTLTGCTADVTAGQVNEGGLRIKLTPAQASYAFTSVTVNSNSVTTTSADDGLGSVYIDIIVNGNITVAATAISGRGIDFTGSTGCSIGAAGVAFNQDLDTTITANEHFTLPASITVKIGNTNVTHTYTKAQDGKSATLHIDAANITGDLTITCTADEDAHAVLDLTNVGSGITINKANNAHVYVGDTISVLPDSGNKVTASATVGGNAATLTGDTYDGYSYTIGSGDVSSNGTAIAITATADALDTFSIDLTGVTSDVGVTWNTPSTATSTILEGSQFSITLAKVSGTGVLNISTSTMGSETLTPNNGTIATDHVTDDITIAASVAAAPMKVHSWNIAEPQGSAENKPRYLEDDVAGAFRLYSISDVNSLSPSWTPSGGSYSGVYANGKSDNYTAGYGNRDIQVGNGDFTIAMIDVKIASDSNKVSAYDTQQPQLKFYDSTDVASVHGGQTQYVNRQFALQLRSTLNDGGFANKSSGSMYPSIEYMKGGKKKALMNSIGVPCTIPSGHVYHVFFTYSKTTGTVNSYVVDVYNGAATVTKCGTADTENTNIEIACLCIKGPEAGSWATKEYLAGVELYNYALSQADIEDEFSNN